METSQTAWNGPGGILKPPVQNPLILRRALLYIFKMQLETNRFSLFGLIY